MSTLAHHALLALAAGLIAAAALRTASWFTPQGLERVLVACVLGAAAVVIEALAAGLAGLADEAVVLTLLAAATYAGADRAVAAPAIVLRRELSAWRAGASTPQLAAAGASAGLLLGLCAWQLRHPYVSTDGFSYHLPLSAAWAQSGHTASLVDAIQGVPVANYPVTNEVIVAWGLALSSSWVMASVWTPLLAALLALAAWTGLRELKVPVVLRVLALIAFGAQPLAATQLGGPLTDLAATAWLIAAATLCLLARRRPQLLGVALIAAALSFGTKTTGAALLAIAFGAALWCCRRTLRAQARGLALAACVAITVGGVWAIRNLVLHGSPLWPFASGPFGDAVPAAFGGNDASFLSHPRELLSGHVTDYTTTMAGSVVLLAGALLVPLIGRSRAALVTAGLAVLAGLVWAAAPYTGIDDIRLAVGATRYLLPCLAASTLALCVAGRDGGRVGRWVVEVVLVLAILMSVARTQELGFPFVPSAGTAAVLMVLGAAAALAATRLPSRLLAPAGLAAATAGVVLLAAAGPGYLGRHAESGLVDGGLIRAAVAQPEFAGGDFDIAMAPATVGLLRGDKLQHRLMLMGADTSCADVHARARDGWVVVQRSPPTATARRLTTCLRDLRPRYQDDSYALYGV